MKKAIGFIGAFIMGAFALMLTDGEIDITIVLGFIASATLAITNLIEKEN